MKRLTLAVLLPLIVQGCAPETPSTGRSQFLAKCAVCHGSTGRGDGPMAARLSKAPADLTQIAARRGGVWPRLEVMGIVDGYSKRYLPGGEMPIYSDFLQGRLVAFDTGNGTREKVPAALLVITDYLESLQDPAPTEFVP